MQWNSDTRLLTVTEPKGTGLAALMAEMQNTQKPFFTYSLRRKSSIPSSGGLPRAALEGREALSPRQWLQNGPDWKSRIHQPAAAHDDLHRNSPLIFGSSNVAAGREAHLSRPLQAQSGQYRHFGSCAFGLILIAARLWSSC